MNENNDLVIGEMIGKKFNCSCGRTHSTSINDIIVGKNIKNKILECLNEYKRKKIFIFSDTNTYNACGNNIYELLIRNNFIIQNYIYKTKNQLEPDEKTLMKVILEIENDVLLIIGIGSGVINDICKIISSKLKIPYIIIATAPSMDGYASVVSSLFIDKTKKTYHAVYPEAIIGDYEVLNNAPGEMIKAGFGDIIGKYTALADWELSRIINDEYYCETSVQMVKNAVKICSEVSDRIIKREESVVESIFNALIISGIAMGMVGNSRPASGSEHHLSHYWTIDSIKNRTEHSLHGITVGVAAVVIAEFYRLINRIKKLPVKIPDADKIKINLLNAGCPIDPSSINVDKKLFKKSILNAMKLRPNRFTILTYADNLGVIETAANDLLKIFY